MNASLLNAEAAGLHGCPVCGLVSESRLNHLRCPRCGSRLRVAAGESLQHSAAMLVAAALLYLPANFLPVMVTASVRGRDSHTILGGIAELWISGSQALAVIVFIASLVVPLVKMAVLALLIVHAQRRSTWRQRERAWMYRTIESVGHWSMLDVFVVVMLVGMVRFGAFGEVEPGIGLLAFGAVVVLTMVASARFDPRLIWPVMGKPP